MVERVVRRSPRRRCSSRRGGAARRRPSARSSACVSSAQSRRPRVASIGTAVGVPEPAHVGRDQPVARRRDVEEVLVEAAGREVAVDQDDRDAVLVARTRRPASRGGPCRRERSASRETIPRWPASCSRPRPSSDEAEFLAANRASRDLSPAVGVQPAHARGLPRLPAPRSASARSATSPAGATTARSSAGSTCPRSSAATSRSAYLGYCGYAGYAGQGYMTEALGLVLREAFVTLRAAPRGGQHPAGQPRVDRARPAAADSSSRACSPRYLKIGGRWRDHERYALRAETWRARRR